MLPFTALLPDQKNYHVHLCQNGVSPASHAIGTLLANKNFLTIYLVLKMEGKAYTYQLTPSSVRNNYFVSGNPRPREEVCFRTLHDQLVSIAECVSTSLRRYCRIGDRQEIIAKNTPEDIQNFRLFDSEMRFLFEITRFNPTTGSNQYIDQILRNIRPGEKIQSIELHGFTTRDMCPCCFHHMLGFLIQANTSQSDNATFFGNLLNKLRPRGFLKGTTGRGVPVSFYISSLIELGGLEYQWSRYPSYVNEVREKIDRKATLGPVANRDLHCIFLRKNVPGDSPFALTQHGKTKAEEPAVLERANGLDRACLDEAFSTALDAPRPIVSTVIP